MRADPAAPWSDFTVDWFFVPWDRATLTVPTVFTSSTWDDGRPVETIGELRSTREWIDGDLPRILPAAEPPGQCGSPEQWAGGWPGGTPGCLKDPVTGDCLECGGQVIRSPVGTAFGLASGVPLEAVSYAEHCGAYVDIGLSQYVKEAWSATSRHDSPLPDSVAYVLGSDALYGLVPGDVVSYVAGPSSPVSIAWQCPVGFAVMCFIPAYGGAPETIGAAELPRGLVSAAELGLVAEVSAVERRSPAFPAGLVAEVSAVERCSPAFPAGLVAAADRPSSTQGVFRTRMCPVYCVEGVEPAQPSTPAMPVATVAGVEKNVPTVPHQTASVAFGANQLTGQKLAKLVASWAIGANAAYANLGHTRQGTPRMVEGLKDAQWIFYTRSVYGPQSVYDSPGKVRRGTPRTVFGPGDVRQDRRIGADVYRAAASYANLGHTRQGTPRTVFGPKCVLSQAPPQPAGIAEGIMSIDHISNPLPLAGDSAGS